MRQMGAVLTAGVAVLLAACGGRATVTSDGIVTGQLIRVGGPAPGAPLALFGQIEARDDAGHHYTVAVGHDGRFRLHLPAGTYLLTGHSPQIQSGKALCAAMKPVSVTKNGTLTGVPVICQIS